MLGKILKYEIPALGRKLGPLYIACMVTSVMLGLAISTFNNKSEMFTIISAMLYGFAVTAALVMMVIMIIQRFHSNLFGDGAYFSHALPVSAAEHIGGKLIGGLIWNLLGIFALILTGLIIAAFDAGVYDVISGTIDVIKEIIKHVNWEAAVIVLEVIVMAVMSAAKSILMIYAAITVGQLARKHTSLVALGAYIGIVVFETLIGKYVLADLFVKLYTTLSSFGEVSTAFLGTIGVLTLFSALYFVVTEQLMRKHLNLA